MTKAIELADDIVTFWDQGFIERCDIQECAAELRRLAAVEQELADLKAATGEPIGFVTKEAIEYLSNSISQDWIALWNTKIGVNTVKVFSLPVENDDDKSM